MKNGNEIVEPLVNRLRGRYTVDAVIHPETGAEMIGANQLINDQMAEAIVNAGITSVNIRSVLTCQSEKGVCAKCYGANMSTGTQVNIGEAVGIIAAQSIGEPGTQLTMRTFHTGGVAGGDITQGLPRVEELFEARKPKGLAIITDISGTATVNDAKRKREILVADDNGNAESYSIPFGARIKVRTGDVLEAGDELTEGSINPNDILKIKGIQGVQAYLLKEVQKVYRLQGVEIADKHIEIIIRQMLKKCKIEESRATLKCCRVRWWISLLLIRKTRRRWKREMNRQQPSACCSVSPKLRWPPIRSCLRRPSRDHACADRSGY